MTTVFLGLGVAKGGRRRVLWRVPAGEELALIRLVVVVVLPGCGRRVWAKMVFVRCFGCSNRVGSPEVGRRWREPFGYLQFASFRISANLVGGDL